MKWVKWIFAHWFSIFCPMWAYVLAVFAGCQFLAGAPHDVVIIDWLGAIFWMIASTREQ